MNTEFLGKIDIYDTLRKKKYNIYEQIILYLFIFIGALMFISYKMMIKYENKLNILKKNYENKNDNLQKKYDNKQIEFMNYITKIRR
jgi:hypothetical protein